MPKPRKPGLRGRKYNLRRIKATWPYTIQDVASLLDVHKNAVGHWLRKGLHANRQQRPFLIRGDELIRFLSARRKNRRTKCSLIQLYCFKCRAARNPAAGRADLCVLPIRRFRLSALCSDCGTRMNKILGIKRLQQIQSGLFIVELQGDHLIECSEPSVNGDLEMQS